MRKPLLLFFLICFTPAFLFAQSNFKPGYVVGLKGDTTRGYIDYREWSFNPTAINFKQSLADKQGKQLSATDIVAFELTGLEAYRRYNGAITMDDPYHSNEGRDTSTKAGEYFFKILQQGPHVTLYSYTDNVKSRFFIQEPGGPVTELIYRSYLAPDESSPDRGKRQVTENGYFRQLSVVAEKYHLLDASMQGEIRHADYYKQNLLKIISRINGVPKADYEKKYNDPASVSFSASAAVSFSSTDPYDHYKAAGGKSSSAISPVLSAEAGIYTDPNRQELQFLVQGILSDSQYQSIYIYTGSPYVPVKFSYHDLWLALAPQIKYNFYNTPALKLFAGAGIALTFHNYYNAKYDLNYAGTQVTNGNLADDAGFFNKFTMPVIVKAGARINNRIEIFGMYFTPAKVTNDHYLELNYSTVQLGLNYIFK